MIMTDNNPSLKLALSLATAEYEAKVDSIAKQFGVTSDSLLSMPESGLRVNITLSRTKVNSAFNAFQKQNSLKMKDNDDNEGTD